MNRVFHPYTEWECFKNGLYRLPSCQDSKHQIDFSVIILSQPVIFYKLALAMIQDWKVAAEVHLSNRSRNRQAWVGQATCCFSHKAAEHQTKKAWWLLTEEQRMLANKVADEIISIWEQLHA
jgi:hypothetical protein